MKRAALAVILNSGLNSGNMKGGGNLQTAACNVRDRKSLSGSRLMFYFLLLTACFLLFVSAGSSEAAIEKIEVEGLYSISRDEFLNLLDVKTGVDLEPLKLRAGIKRAFLKGVFEGIEVFGDSGEGNLLRIVVKEKDFIGNINITGAGNISPRIVKDHFLLKETEVMRYDLLDEAVKKLRDTLSERGFPAAKAAVTIVKGSKPYTVNIDLQISEGAPEIIREINIRGGSVTDIRGVMDTLAGDIYDQTLIKKDMEKITAYYAEMGYMKPEVTYSFAEGRLEVDIKAGKMLNVIFDGNKVVDSKTLRKEALFSGAGALSDEFLEEASLRLLSLYRSKGYLFAQVVPVTTNGENPDTTELHFFIYEGDKVSVKAISFSGVSLPAANLKEIISTKEGEAYNPGLLPTDIEALKEFYNALGYLNVQVEEPVVKITDSGADIGITIKEGRQTFIDRIDITGALNIAEEETRKAAGIKSGAPYNDVDLSDARLRIMDLYLDHGFIDAEVAVKTELEAAGARVIFEIKEGTKTWFGKTIITGNHKTRRDVIIRELPYREAEIFNYSLLAKGRQRLYKLGLFTEISIEPLDRYGDRKDVHISVAEGNAGYVEFGAGYGDYDKYRGFMEVGYRNLSGMDRQGFFRVDLSALSERYTINYYEPWFLETRIPFRVLLLREYRTEKNIDTGEVRYKLRRHTATAGFEKKLNQELKAELYYEFSYVNTYDVKPDVILTREDTGTLAVSSIRPGIIYDTRDNPFEPKSGILAGVTMKAASGLLGSQTDFIKIMFNGNFYKELLKSIVLAASFRGGLAQGLSSTTELPLVERFFLGGRNTVRGYAQDMLGPRGSDGTPTGGNSFLMTNLEVRTYVGKSLGVVGFVDGGNVWIKAKDMNFTFKYAAGMGLRYNTPVGPLRIDYGYKLAREAGESRGELHFSIGHAF